MLDPLLVHLVLRRATALCALGALFSGCPDAGHGHVDLEQDAGSSAPVETLDASSPVATPDAGSPVATPDAGSPVATPDAGAPTLRPTHSGLVSLQEVSLANLAEATRTLTFQASFAPAQKPDYEELPGEVGGCKAWVYDVATRPPPVEEPHVVVGLGGLQGGALQCRFDAMRGYACSDATHGDAGLLGAPLGSLSAYALPDLPPVTVELSPTGLGAFDAAKVELTPGSPFTLDTASRARIDHFPLDGEAVTLSCDGPGGSCGAAAASIVRINATDGDVRDLGPTAMPKPLRRSVEISCAAPGRNTVTIPAAAMALLARANEVSRLTRTRTAFMRDGFAIVSNASPRPPNRTIFLSGRALIAYTDY